MYMYMNSAHRFGRPSLLAGDRGRQGDRAETGPVAGDRACLLLAGDRGRQNLLAGDRADEDGVEGA